MFDRRQGHRLGPVTRLVRRRAAIEAPFASHPGPSGGATQDAQVQHGRMCVCVCVNQAFLLHFTEIGHIVLMSCGKQLYLAHVSHAP